MTNLKGLALGRLCLCLDVVDLDATCSFYSHLGFSPVGEDAPGLRVSMANGAHVLTFMSFLNSPVLNFRGGHIYELLTELSQCGFVIEEYNTEPGTLLMKDERGDPLPKNECGHFSVSDPDGREILFNTLPVERQPYLNALRGKAGQGDFLHGALKFGLHQVQIRFDTVALDNHISFYQKMGLSILRVSESGKMVTMGLDVTPPSAAVLGFAFQLRKADSLATSLVFHCQDPKEMVQALEAAGISVVACEEGLRRLDPDGRYLIFQGND